MEYWIFLIISYTGLGFGWQLAKIAWNEVKQYHKMLVLIRFSSVVIIFALLASLADELLIPVVAFALFVLFFVAKKTMNAYAMLPAFLYCSFRVPETIPWVASLIFIYGLSEGSVQALRLKHKGKSLDGLLTVLIQNYWFLAVGAILGIAL